MSEETPTSTNEPADSPATSVVEPGTTDDAVATPQSPPAETELQQRLARLEANLKGRASEADELRRERDQMRDILARYQTQPQAMPQAQQMARSEPSDEDLAEQENQAFLEGDKRKLAEIRRLQRERAKREAMGEMAQTLQQYSTIASKQQAFTQYMASRGINDPNSQIFKDVQGKMQELMRDPSYAFVADNPMALGTIAIEQVAASKARAKAGAEEEKREKQVEGAFTESGKGKATMPGKAAPSKDKMYFTAGELKFIQHDMRTKGLSEEEAKKKMWAAMLPHVRQRRVDEGRA